MLKTQSLSSLKKNPEKKRFSLRQKYSIWLKSTVLILLSIPLCTTNHPRHAYSSVSILQRMLKHLEQLYTAAHYHHQILFNTFSMATFNYHIALSKRASLNPSNLFHIFHRAVFHTAFHIILMRLFLLMKRSQL